MDLEIKVYDRAAGLTKGWRLGAAGPEAKCSSCGCDVGPKSRPAPRRAGPRPPSDVAKFAEFVAMCAHRIMGRPGRFEPPELRWYHEQADPNTLAYVQRVHPHVVNLSLAHGDNLAHLADTIVHEVRHLEQWNSGLAASEDEAGRAGRFWGSAIERAWQLTDGALSQVYYRKDGPPWYDLPRGSVVLHRGRAFNRNPSRNGPAWAGSR